MDANELAQAICELINTRVEHSEAYVSSGGDSKSASVEVAFDEEEKLFHLSIKEINQ